MWTIQTRGRVGVQCAACLYVYPQQINSSRFGDSLRASPKDNRRGKSEHKSGSLSVCV